MDLDWIEDFLALAETGIFSKAAMRRNVTQPAFTRRIRKLEYALGAVLFDRSVHPVVLTPAGQEFRASAAEVRRTLSTAKALLREMGASSEMVSISSLQSLASAFLPGLIADLYRPRVPPPVRVMPDDFAGCVEALLTGAADLMLSYAHPQFGAAGLDGRFTSRVVGEDVLMAVSGTDAGGEPLFDLGDADLAYLRYSDESFLGRVTQHLLAGSELSGRLVPRYQNSMADGLRMAARAGLGVAFLPGRIAAEDLAAGRLVRISTPAEELRLSITLFREDAPRSRLVERFWTLIAQHAERISPSIPDQDVPGNDADSPRGGGTAAG